MECLLGIGGGKENEGVNWSKCANCQKQAIHLARAKTKAKVASQGWPVMLRLRPCIKVVKDLTFLQNVSLPTFKLRWKLSLIFTLFSPIYNDLSL